MFNRRFALLLTLACAVLAASTSVCAQSLPIEPEDLRQIMLVKDVKPGMRGYGKTVFRGTKIETFEVEVLGVMEKMNFGKSLILVRMKGGPITERGANLIQGMSGSPVYVGGKLLGAFAYGEVFIKEPIGMVTPIENMLDAWDPSLPTEPSTFYPLATDLSKPIPLGGKLFGRVAIDDGSGRDYGSDTLVFRPLAMPLMVRGMSPRIMSQLEEKLRPMNVVPVAGPATPADKTGLNVTLEPGAAVGVSLATGDLDITGIGTVTYRRGNRILAFGHPMISGGYMNGLGPIEAAMTTAWVHEVFPSLLVSSKVASPIKTVGTVFQDRPWSIGGEIGKMPKMIPITIHVDDKSLGRKRDYNVQVLNHPMFASSLIVGSTAEAVFEMRGTPDDASAKVRTEVVAEEVGSIVRENVYFDPVAIDMAATGDLQSILTLLEYNRFYPVRVRSVDVRIEIEREHPTAQIERLFLKESKFRPGDTVEVGVVVKPFKSEPVTRTVSIELPKNLPNGRLPLTVRGAAGGSPSMMEGPSMQDEGGAPPGAPGATVENIQQLIKKFLEREKNNEMTARVMLPRSAVTIAGEKLTGLPPTIAEAMRSPKATVLGSQREEVKVVVSTEWVITGQQQLMITVESRNSADKPPAGTPSETAPQEEPSGGEQTSEESGGSEEMIAYPSQTSPLISYAAAELLSPLGVPMNGAAASVQETTVSASAEETPDESQPTEDGKTEAKPKPDEKAVIRAPGVWKQTSRADFLLGTMTNTAATTKDSLVLGGTLEPMYESTETYFWCMIPDGSGGIYAGTGNRGIVYRIAADGKASVFCDIAELQVHSLARDSLGNVYAGTSPNGIVYRINPGGVPRILLDADEKYVVALCMDTKGNLYSAVGDRCKVYKTAPDGGTEVVLDSSEAHALSLAADKNDNIYVGTGLNGIIYRISTDGSTSVVYDAAEPSVSALTVGADGYLYAGTSPKGVLYRLSSDSAPKAVFDKAGQGVISMTASGDGSIYAANAKTVYRLIGEDTVAAVSNDRDLQFMSLASDESRLYAGTGNVGSVYTTSVNALEGAYESPVHDCRAISRWGRIGWTADLPSGASLSVRTRTGDVAEPDSSWSRWSSNYTSPDMMIESPRGRYIQYQVAMKAQSSDAIPVLKDVSIAFVTMNQQPKVTLASPKGGEKWARTKTIKWIGSDPDKDVLTYEVFCSNDGGSTWLPLSESVKPAEEETPEETGGGEDGTPAEEEVPAQDEAVKVDLTNPEEVMAQMAAELEKHPEIPKDVKEKIMAEAPEMIEKAKQEKDEAEKAKTPAADAKPAEKSAGGPTRSTSYNWDTAKHPDGVYRVKVVASDRTSSPTDAMTAEAISEPIIVCNKLPRVTAFKKTMTVLSDSSARIEGAAYHDLVGIAGVQYKVDTGDWAAAAPDDGIFDSTFESFAVTTQVLVKGAHTVEIKAVDQAGNATTTKVTVNVQ
ncbi:MAG: hypothetical protein KBC96_03565 [Armatimonadetes bacterium]|nr:hypothetical protein [Armatimonadota bacterium]